MPVPFTAWPATPEHWHAWFITLDARYRTSPASPLHHDQRCPLPGHRIR